MHTYTFQNADTEEGSLFQQNLSKIGFTVIHNYLNNVTDLTSCSTCTCGPTGGVFAVIQNIGRDTTAVKLRSLVCVHTAVNTNYSTDLCQQYENVIYCFRHDA